ncbi:MAG: two-component system, LuxR family, response regulator FixJ [Sphingomonadales bacterium]|jgi:two-component system response regulator FixJ|nr:two-component system, LuxR family, response regulator FixJ [Sphingomonadales bacterium]
MPGSDGLAVLRVLRDRGGSPPVLVITAYGDLGVAVQAMKLGAHDFIEKPYGAADLVASVESALESCAQAQDERTLRNKAIALVGALTQRQRQILRGIFQGMPNKIIAFELGLSIRTVEAYRSQLLAKLGARSTAEAVRLAIAAGIGDEGLSLDADDPGGLRPNAEEGSPP